MLASLFSQDQMNQTSPVRVHTYFYINCIMALLPSSGSPAGTHSRVTTRWLKNHRCTLSGNKIPGLTRPCVSISSTPTQPAPTPTLFPASFLAACVSMDQGQLIRLKLVAFTRFAHTGKIIQPPCRAVLPPPPPPLGGKTLFNPSFTLLRLRGGPPLR